ncbi:hypothetical protein I6F35_09810 [Bradyrhizobium sp. BRP22]|nr:hypothetical protein [Bradyrhizobium sp. BRP22]MCA1453509.1 hypothetical protein [Bradyrhizobium sp. BRP22]
MHPPEATLGPVGMIRAGLLPLDLFKVTTFDLDHVNEAVAHAAANGGPFKMTILQPAQGARVALR